MIEFHYNLEKISETQAPQLCVPLEEALRSALRRIRPDRGDDYGVFIEGSPFDVSRNHADLNIYVFYHPSWEFTENELPLLPEGMSYSLIPTLRALGIRVSVRIRFYRRDGYAGTSFSV